MNEDVLATIVRLNEAIALRFVIPLHSTSRHRIFLKSRQMRCRKIILPCLATRSSVWLTARSSRTSSYFHPPVQGPSFRAGWLWSRSDQLRATNKPDDHSPPVHHRSISGAPDPEGEGR
jgi:hypothetical protein